MNDAETATTAITSSEVRKSFALLRRWVDDMVLLREGGN